MARHRRRCPESEAGTLSLLPYGYVGSSAAVAPVVVIAGAVWPVVFVELGIGLVVAETIAVRIVPVIGVEDDQESVQEGEGIVVVLRRQGSRSDGDGVIARRAAGSGSGGAACRRTGGRAALGVIVDETNDEIAERRVGLVDWGGAEELVKSDFSADLFLSGLLVAMASARRG